MCLNNDYIINSSMINYNYEQNLIANVLQESKIYNSKVIDLNYILVFQNLQCTAGGQSNDADL